MGVVVNTYSHFWGALEGPQMGVWDLMREERVAMTIGPGHSLIEC
jgi:hypothetical protein